MQEDTRKIAKKVQKAMIDQDMSYDDLSRLTGYSREHLSRVINGHIDSPKVKKFIALVLGHVDIWDE